MGASLGEILVLIAIFGGLYYGLRPIRRAIEARLENWLRRMRGPDRTAKIYDVTPKTKKDQDH